MATGSQAAAKTRLQAASYRTRQPQYATRCDTCTHCTAGGTGKQHGRYCEHHRAGVKTHGVCDSWTRRSAP